MALIVAEDKRNTFKLTGGIYPDILSEFLRDLLWNSASLLKAVVDCQPGQVKLTQFNPVTRNLIKTVTHRSSQIEHLSLQQESAPSALFSLEVLWDSLLFLPEWSCNVYNTPTSPYPRPPNQIYKACPSRMSGTSYQIVPCMVIATIGSK